MKRGEDPHNPYACMLLLGAVRCVVNTCKIVNKLITQMSSNIEGSC